MNGVIKLMHPPFSVLISIYFREHIEYLRASLESIIQQTLLPSEVVLVEDGPLSIGLEKTIETYKTRFIKKGIDFQIVKLKKNQGLGNTLNLGLKICSNDLVARMDTDDICLPSRFETQVNFLIKHPIVSVVGSDIIEFSDDSKDTFYKKMPQKNIVKFSKLRNPLCHPSVMFHKKDVLKVGSYKECTKFEDYFLWIRLLEANFQVTNVGMPLVRMRANDDQYSRRGGLKYLKNTVYFIRRASHIGFFNKVDAFRFFLSRFITAVIPTSMLTYLYKKKLRKKIN